ncbi:hypothetical protein N7533_011134 [Penicillium manginii]|jgi:hypothetical protein|uniref:uncharacterized protein n=1 Tax=Penicillium manginii TaxID=203109 RepID=UPI002547B755|nr:uncharacterized protein N7533_011134 [Penicillium manginii]KAJ5741725.1 hypothetical protein N7533_011134 [Penicillium manginii]
MQSALADDDGSSNKSDSCTITPRASSSTTSATTHLPGQITSKSNPSDLQQSHASPQPLDPNSSMVEQTRYLQTMIFQQESQLWKVRVEQARQSRAIDIMFEELSHTNAHLNHTSDKVTRLAENIKDLFEELSHQRELTPQALCEMSRIREQLEILRNHISAYASEGAQARAPLSRGNISLTDWAASVMPRRPSSVRTEDSRYWPYPQ